ncbi:MAG: c-type cytochrome [Chitinophagales bacterium]
MKKLLIFFMPAAIFFSCGKEEKKDIVEKKQAKEAMSGKDIYTKYCKLCHGVDGKLGLSNAADLSISVLTTQEKINVITNGRKAMTPFKDQLTQEQIRLVTEYIETLHQ